MHGWFGRASAAACIGVFAVTVADAQEMIAEKHTLTGFAARRIIEVCLVQAARDHFPVALAVVDPAGYLLSYQAADGATGNTGETAQLKAKTAARFRRSTAELYDRINKQVNRAPEWQGYFAIPGGYPILAGGEVVGAIGVGAAGLSGGKDENCAQSAVKAVVGDGKSAPPPSPQPLLASTKVLTAAAARKLADACIAYAGANRIRAIGVSVVDPEGNLLSFQSTNGTSSNGLKSAQLKAVTAAHWRRATEELFQRVNTKANRAPEWKGDFPEPGGLPIFIGSDMVGAIGAGGGAGNQDGQCAEAAVKAVFPNAATSRAS
jgi:glc operon protein GlcG